MHGVLPPISNEKPGEDSQNYAFKMYILEFINK